MPPIPVHIDDPISPAKAGSIPSNTNKESAQSQASLYPAAQPGAAAVPAPTPYAPAPQQQLPPPTRTTTTSLQYAPPPPQPGAVPVPSQTQPQAPMTSGLPPPPKAGEVASHASITQMPPQSYVPPPGQNYAPTRSTTTDLPSSYQPHAPTTLNFGPVGSAPSEPASRPPGYQQNVFAQELSSAQRASLDQHESRDGLGAGLGLGGSGSGDATNDTVGNVWNTVVGWANVAGTKLAETEEEVWKRINGK